MDLRQLAALTAVADHHSFSAAARALHTVQSNISTHVARLEKELSAVLVDRSTGELTDAGELVVARARQIHAELAAITADVTSLQGDVAGQVRIGVIGTTGRWLVPALLNALGSAHPRVRLVTIDATTTSLLPQLSSGRLDLAVVNLPATDPDVEVEALFEEDHVLLTPAEHPLASRDRVELTELSDTPLLLEPPGTGFRDHLDNDANRLGVRLVSQAEVDGMRLLAALAQQGFGAAVLPASAMVDWTHPTRKAVALDGATRRGVGLAIPRRGRQTAAARATADVLRSVVETEVPNLSGLHLVR